MFLFLKRPIATETFFAFLWVVPSVGLLDMNGLRLERMRSVCFYIILVLAVATFANVKVKDLPFVMASLCHCNVTTLTWQYGNDMQYTILRSSLVIFSRFLPSCQGQLGLPLASRGPRSKHRGLSRGCCRCKETLKELAYSTCSIGIEPCTLSRFISSHSIPTLSGHFTASRPAVCGRSLESSLSDRNLSKSPRSCQW